MKEVKSNGTLNKIFEYKFNERGKIQWEIKIKYHKNTI